MRFFVFLMTLLLGLPLFAKDIMNMRVYGNDSSTRLYLFTSHVCPHCAQFHQEIMPEIQKKYLNERGIQLVVVDMVMNKPDLWGAMLVRCAPDDKVEAIESTLYSDQMTWGLDENKARAYLAELALRNGISAGEFETCLGNKKLEKNIQSDQERMARLYNVQHMPTLVIRQGEKTSSWEGADKDVIMDGLAEFF